MYDRDNVWSVTESKAGRTQYSTVLAVNHIRTKRLQYGDETIYQPYFYTTAFKLSWTISQYIFVSGVVASQSRVSAEVIFASVQPLWEDGKITDKTRVHIGVRTVLENAYQSHLMMVFIKESDSGTFAVLEEGETPISIKAERYSTGDRAGDRVLCERHRNYDLEKVLGDDSYYFDCHQTWEFSIILPQNVTVYNEVQGLFSFQLQLYQCDDLNLENPNCTPIDGTYEEILANIELDTVVEVTAEQESALTLEVTAIRSKDNAAEFLTSNALSRGIYHGEQVIVYIQPTQNINKTPGADLISQHGLALSAFIICIESQIPPRSKLGCLDAEKEHRYIPWMEDDLRVSLRGKIYTRDDFEEKKQKLNSTQHGWNPETGYYTIQFKNLALSSQTRLYRFTMIFRVDIPDAGLSRRRRSALLADTSLTSRERRETKLTCENCNEVTPGEANDSESETETMREEDEEDISPQEGSVAGENVKVSPCPPGQEYVSINESCRRSSAVTHHYKILMLLFCLGYPITIMN